MHPATASRALNPETRLLVSEETARRVLAAAAELGYRPNTVARSLRTRRSHTVGVLIPDLNNPLFPPMVRGLEDRLDADGYVALIGNTDGDDARERRVFEQMRARHVDGYVLATAHLRNPLLDEAVRAGVPVVLMNRIAEDYSFPSVTVDNERGVQMAVSHLTALGHRAHRLHRRAAGCVDRAGQVPRFPGGDGRRRSAGAAGPGGLRPRVLDRGGLPVRPEILAAGGDCTAVAAGNDMLAVGCYLALDEAGLRCPADMSGGRLQRHAVHRHAEAAADHGRVPALPGRHRGRAAADRAAERGRRAGEGPLPGARADRPGLHRARPS